jgi:hypothetical protein
MSTEQPTPRELKQGIADKLAMMPAGLDSATGKTDVDRAADEATVATITAAMADPEPAAQGGMHRNRAQGHSGPAVDAPPPSNALESVRLQLRKIL